MKEIFAYVLEFMLTLAEMLNNSKITVKKGSNILKVIQAFHTVCIDLYMGYSGPVVRSLTATY